MSRYCFFRPAAEACGAPFLGAAFDRAFMPSREWRMIGFRLGRAGFRAAARFGFFINVLLSETG